jgi:inner membrane protein
VKGVFSSDRTRADGRYFVLDAVGSEFVVLSKDGMPYQTGEQIVAEKLTIVPGDRAKVQTSTLTFEDEEARIPAIEGLVWVNGEVTIDFPEELQIPVSSYPVARVSGSTLKLSYCPLDLARQLLSGQYAIGSLSVKSISPAPTWN